MRALGVAAGLAFALAGFGCAAHSPEAIPDKPVSYNRRELPPAPGLLTGPDGSWTLYSNDPPPAKAPAAPEQSADPPRPRHREVLMCDHSQKCEQPDAAH